MSSEPISIFFSYSRKDAALMQELEDHLEPLKLSGLINSWHDGCIEPGEEWESKIKDNLETAQIILLLISIDFIKSSYCYDVELRKAIDRHKARDAYVIPVILRSCLWTQVPVGNMYLGDLQALPKDAKPISQWTDRDEAYTNIAEELYEKIQKLQQDRLKNTVVFLNHAKQHSYPGSAQTLNKTPQNKQVFEYDLRSEKDINYTHLHNLLRDQDWEAADSETHKLMLRAINQNQGNRFTSNNIFRFPCTDLLTIDHIWSQCSGNQFGFSVQKEIWQKCGNPSSYSDWRKFCVKVGWQTQKGIIRQFSWIDSSQVIFSLAAPKGHLPSLGLSLDFTKDSISICSLLFLRLEKCKGNLI